MSVKLVLVKTYFGAFFKNFFSEFENSMKFCVFDTFFDIFQNKFFKGHISTFSYFEAKRAKNGAKNKKNYKVNVS
jgi:hypothetical protein